MPETVYLQQTVFRLASLGKTIKQNFFFLPQNLKVYRHKCRIKIILRELLK